MRSLAGKLRVSGLEVKAVHYPRSRAGDAGPIEEIEVDNPNAPARGTIRVTDDGELMREYFGRLDTEQDMNELVGIITAMLCVAPQPSTRPGSTS
jgi:hypothetical protein